MPGMILRCLYMEKEKKGIDRYAGELVKTHGQWNEDAARSQLLKIFEARGHLDEHTIEGEGNSPQFYFVMQSPFSINYNAGGYPFFPYQAYYSSAEDCH